MNEKTAITLDAATQKNVDLWLQGNYDEKTKADIKKLLEENPKEIIDAFYTNLSFGTGGLRGVMGVGSNRMNRYTVGAATQGLANYLNQQPKPPHGHTVLIGYDSRHHSREFAEESAQVLAGNDIKVLIFKELRPTPLVSFGCRLKGCSSAIMITASHNPPEYNGYKVYWNDGAQILPPHDKNIIAEVNKISNPSQVKKVASSTHPLIEWVGEEIDEAYVKAIRSLQNYPEDNKQKGKDLKIVYTSLHGTGITMVPKALQDWGFTQITLVTKQVIPDGDFPTAHHPNPEEKAALKLGIDTLVETKGDIFIATDPDCDRMGIVTQDQKGTHIFNGNQIACLCLYHLCTNQKKLPTNAAFVKTVVTTELFKTICEAYERPCYDVLTGFKYIAEKIREWEQNPKGPQFLFGAEESYGYLLGTLARDKDAIILSALISEVALHAKLNSQSLLDVLHEIYHKYGYYYEKLLSVEFAETREGREQMKKGIEKIQAEHPKEILGIPVQSVEDYHLLIKKDLVTGKTEKINLPQTEMLVFWLADKSKLVIRPSGTEPKIKIYCGVAYPKFDSIDKVQQQGEKHADELLQALASQLSKSA
jgi:phosphomannomutase